MKDTEKIQKSKQPLPLQLLIDFPNVLCYSTEEGNCCWKTLSLQTASCVCLSDLLEKREGVCGIVCRRNSSDTFSKLPPARKTPIFQDHFLHVVPINFERFLWWLLGSGSSTELLNFPCSLSLHACFYSFPFSSQATPADLMMFYLGADKFSMLRHTPDDKCPLLKGLVKRVGEIPRIKEWCEKRPKTDW